MDNLTERAQALRQRIAEYRSLLEGPREDVTTVYLGENYFASMPRDECTAFLSRRIDALNSELSVVDQLSGVGEDGLPIFDIVEELDDSGQVVSSNMKRAGLGGGSGSGGSVGDSGVPETINAGIKDEKEPIASEPKPLGLLPDSSPEPAEDDGSASAKAAAFADAAVVVGDGESQSEFEHIETSPPHDEDEHIEASPPQDEDEQDVQYIEDVSESPEPTRPAEDTSQGEYRDIDPADILELELLDGSDEENINYDFDNIEEDDDDDDDDEYNDRGLVGDGSDDSEESNNDDEDDDDGFGFGWQRGSLFPQDEATRKLIEAHLAQKDALVSVASDTDSKLPSKADAKSGKHSNVHVHFADTVDVREFETSPAERKGVIYDRKPSRFSMARQQARTMAPGRSTASPLGSASTLQASKTRSAAAAAAAAAGAAAGAAGNSAARHGPSSQMPVHGAVRERGAPAAHSLPPPVRRANPASPPAAKSQTRPPVSPPKAAAQSPVSQKRATKPTTDAPNHEQQQVVSQASPDRAPKDQNKAAHKTTATPIKAPKFEAPAPSRAKSAKETIAEKANKYYEQSFLPDAEFLKLHDQEEHDVPKQQSKGSKPEVGESSTQTTQPSSSQRPTQPHADRRPIVSAEVLEREPAPLDDNANDSSDDNAPDMREIKHEYQRLRQHLIYESGGFKKKDSEKATEPIEDNGAPKKVSRFKAARVAS